MMQNIFLLVAFLLLQKFADAVADKVLEKPISNENLQRWKTLLKL
ncbi:MAG: hypothetical protein SVX43_03760 [Cyanobacteriota bacterium]|nr:hypothetical protein [Cyanobacteriota bacterium]